MNPPCNIAAALVQRAGEAPGRIALRCPGPCNWRGVATYSQSLSYRELDTRSDAIAAGLVRHGIQRGMRTVVMVRPSPEFFLLMFALFKAGAVPVLVDPGIQKSALKQCLAEARPEAFIGIPLAQFARRLLGWARGTIRHSITVGRTWFWGGLTLAELERAGHGAGAQLAATSADETAAILFTSGSTGVPKGVVYRHRHFVAQIEMLRDAFGIEPGGVDMPTFPPFALFDPALGLGSIIPDMDPTRPAKADPRKLHAAIERFGVNQLFGSPALMRVLADYGKPLPTLRRVTSAGAPVPAEVVATLRTLLPAEAQFWTPYGATECLPVAVIEGAELASMRELSERGAGTCVGYPVRPNVVRIIAISDEAIAEWGEVRELEPGSIGEITVAGPSATDEYFNRPEATRLAKIREAQGCASAAEGRMPKAAERIVHRMGDVGWFDAQGRLWFCGRKSHRVRTELGTLFTEQVEPVFNTHPRVRRTALVGVGPKLQQTPVLCVEFMPGVARSEHPALLEALRRHGEGFVHTARVQQFLVHPGFPVDIRHNAKIGREQLAIWAARQLGLAQ